MWRSADGSVLGVPGVWGSQGVEGFGRLIFSVCRSNVAVSRVWGFQ